MEHSNQQHLRSVVLPKNIKAAANHRRVLAVVLIKFPTLEEINQKRGYEVGDFLLSQAWFRVSQFSKSADCIQRYSGSKFCLVLPLIADTSIIELVLGKLDQLMSRPYSYSGESLSLPFKFGGAFSESGFNSAEELLQAAEQALNIASKSPLNWDIKGVDSESKSSLGDLHSAIRNAVHNDELELFFQPQVSLESGQCVGFESLLRWKHTGIYISPELFIPYAENSDLIFLITDWCIHNSVRLLQKLDTLNVSTCNLSVSINLSGKCLADESILQSIKNTLSIWNVAPERLVIELTETAFIADLERAALMCNRLKNEIGVRISLDDFGTGYSSLEILRCVPADEVKIDKSFVNRVDEDFRCLKIVENIILLGESLNLSVVAEGVESEAVLKKLKTRSKCRVQGFLISKPLKNSQLVDWLKNDARRLRASFNLKLSQ